MNNTSGLLESRKGPAGFKMHPLRAPVLIALALLAICSYAQALSLQEGDYATLDSVVDSLGNTNTNSWSKGTGGDWSCAPGCPDLRVEVGETISLTASATDPNGRPLQYKFSLQPPGGVFGVLQDWGASPTFVWHVDPSHAGPNVVLAVSVRNDDGNDYQGAFMGDDYTYATYQVVDPAYSPATLVSVVDSLGNTNTNSWSKGTGGDWSCAPSCPDLGVEVGETITLTASAADPNGRPLEYKFSLQPPGGVFGVVQDWSASPTYVWHVDTSQVGPNVVLAVSVRNDDGSDYQGVSMGDDYTYATYLVVDPAYSPATLVSLTDSLGNTNTNSWNKGTGADWPIRPTAAISDVIAFTAIGTDTQGLPLEYKYARQRVGSSFEVVQDWSSSNVYTWTVTLDDYGSWVTIAAHVRNDDGQDWHGSWNGDDYAYATYQVLTVREIITEAGGSLMAPNADGTIALLVSSGTVTGTTVFSYTEDLDSYSLPEGYTIVGNAFALGAERVDETPVVSFTKPISMELTCGEQTLVDEDSLILFYFDELGSEWLPVDQDPSTVGPCRFVAETTHFTRFAFGSQVARIYLPMILRHA